MGASLAFYSVLSLAPLLILVVGICALVFGAAGAQAQILEQFRQMVGGEGARAVETVLKSAQKPASGIVASIIGLLTLLFGASGVFVELRSALNKLWDVEARTPTNGIWAFIKDRFLSFGMVLAIGFLLLVSLVLSAALGAAGKVFGNVGFLPPAVWEVLNFLVSLGVVATVFALILKFVPDIRLPWRDIWRGAALTAILFTVGKTLIGIYLGKAGVGSAYGAAGSLVVLVVWIYYSAQIFFLGAMFTRVYSRAHEEHRERKFDTPKVKPVFPVHEPRSERDGTGVPRHEERQSTLARIAAGGLIIALLKKVIHGKNVST